ncbi:hypothetical protein V4F39_09970 [Aquincola sp. MAHUQ-54]|uniref:Uncharacterized protein n=1 Tax=Aquincola agrisoli TaxID=3119538 RepID=A0AAW9QEV9_9BURK
MDSLQNALRGAQHPRPAAPLARRAVVAGAAGALGAAVLEQLLGRGGFAAVAVTTLQPLHPTPRGMATLPWPGVVPHLAAFGAQTGVIVLDAPRLAHGREAALHRPLPQDLAAVAAAFHQGGIDDLLVVLPHDAARVPDALKAGLANLDEQAVASLGFRHVVFMRPARAPQEGAADGALQRVAQLMLSQLRFMVPQRDRPVRAAKVAEFAAELARGLAQAPGGTRVVPAELVWQASQQRDATALAQAWLAGEALPPPHERAERM